MSPCPNGQKSQLSKPFSLSAAGSSYLASLERSLTRTIAAQVVAIVVNSILYGSVYIRAIRGQSISRENTSFCGYVSTTEPHGTTRNRRYTNSPCPSGQKSQLSKPFSLSAAESSYLASLERSLTRTIAAQVVAIVVNSILCVSVYIRAISGRYMFAGIF